MSHILVVTSTGYHISMNITPSISNESNVFIGPEVNWLVLFSSSKLYQYRTHYLALWGIIGNKNLSANHQKIFYTPMLPDSGEYCHAEIATLRIVAGNSLVLNFRVLSTLSVSNFNSAPSS